MKHKYSREFESLWITYPKRAGGNPKPKAYKAYQARIKEGYTHAEIMAGLMRYRAYCEKTAVIGSEFVMQAATFFGPDERFLEPYDLPKPKPKAETIEERAKRLGIQARPGESWEDFNRRVMQSRE